MAATYLITGGAGFIGRALCTELAKSGSRIRVIDSLVPQVHAETTYPLPAGTEFLCADLRDGDQLEQALCGVDGVFHLAAEVGVGQSMYEIERYVGGNDLATAVLLERLAQRPVKRLVVASSMSVYGEGLYRNAAGERCCPVRRSMGLTDPQWDPVAPDGEPLVPVPTDEAKPVALASIYALTKYMQEQSCLIVGSAYGIEVVALRLFNVFGVGQALSNPYTGVLANFGARLANGEPPLVFEDGQQRRDFVHVRDVARAFRLAMQSPAAAGHTFNIGSGHSYTIAQVAGLLAAALGVPDVAPRLLHKARTGDIRHCFADITKAQRLLGYRPQPPAGGLAR
ncbi:MAG TPA: NAD-dependent epimerase/dehydratase family protein [Acetobacteraceae bacterium]|nr:NAD-dependent epimerase/dehydratase family protein [Acetobacteraceae bacterium]